jgi:hypothetical protein
VTAVAVSKYDRPRLYDKQAAFLFTPARYSITEASTKTGKTVGCIAWLFEQAAAGQEGHNYWWVAPVYKVAKIAYRRMKRAIPRQLYSANETELTLTLRNGAVIWFKGADTPDNLYGEDVYAAVIDEASRCKEEAWHAVRSTLTATRGPIRIIGNVKGRKNWAYHLARKAQGGAKDMAYFKLTAWDAVAGGVLDRAEIEDAEAVLPPEVFRELYLAEPSDDGGNPFGLAAIAACVTPLSTAPPVAFGVDLARSVDWTVVIGLDAQGRVCRFERWPSSWEMTIPRVVTLTHGVQTLVDATGAGDPVMASLWKAGNWFQAFTFTQPSKQQLMEELAMEIHQRQIGFPDGVIRSELEAFEYEWTRTGARYSAPEGEHDDTVIALALAKRMQKRGIGHRDPYARIRARA